MPPDPDKLGNLEDEITVGLQSLHIYRQITVFRRLIHTHCALSQSYDVLSQLKHINHTQHYIVQQIDVPVSQEAPQETSAPSHP